MKKKKKFKNPRIQGGNLKTKLSKNHFSSNKKFWEKNRQKNAILSVFQYQEDAI